MHKDKQIIGSVLLVSVLLLSTHEGEFWPFSIFPMFSQAGQTWSRGIIENVQDTTRSDLWTSRSIAAIEHRILPLREYGIQENDLANYLSTIKTWDENMIKGLRTTFQIDRHPGQYWLATRVVGSINEQDSVIVKTVPMFLFTADTMIKNPNLFPN